MVAAELTHMFSCAERLKAEFGPNYLLNLKVRDPETEAHFASYFSTYLESKLRGQLKNREAAEDVRQETLVRVLEAVYTKEELKHPERFGAFVNSVCNNVLLEYWRRLRSAGETLEQIEQIDGRRNPESAAQLAQEVRYLRKVMPKLQKRDRELLRMVYWDERDRIEISRTTELSADHLRVMLHRAKRSLRRCLEECAGTDLRGPRWPSACPKTRP